MSKFVSVKGFSHSFSNEDWRKICGLAGRSSGKVEFSEGVATINDGTVFITLSSPGGGKRVYDIDAEDLF
ncbi:MAG: hypothetical protein RIR18_1083 [Pseudomonadota bacterium]